MIGDLSFKIGVNKQPHSKRLGLQGYTSTEEEQIIKEKQ